MLHPYAIFFKAMWDNAERPPTDDVEPVPPSARRRLWLRLLARRPAVRLSWPVIQRR